MAAGGKRQGAGRKPGLPNKRSELRIERALREGRRLPPESLLLIADQQLAMVEYYQPEITDETGARVKNPSFDEERYDHWMMRARETLTAAAPYYASKLQVMAAEVHHTSEISISQKLETTMSPEEAMRQYIKMIDAKPL